MKLYMSLYTVILLLSCFLTGSATPVREQHYKGGDKGLSTQNGGTKVKPGSPGNELKLAESGPLPSHSQQGKLISTPLFQYDNQVPFILLRFGTPAAVLRIAINTAENSSDLWVLSADCNFSKCKELPHTAYDHKGSVTYVKNGTKYDNGVSSGYLSQDYVYVEGQRIESQVFGEAVKINLLNWEYRRFDGMLSLSVQSLSHTGLPSLFSNLRNVIDEPVFGIYYASPDPRLPPNIALGEFLVGGRDHKYYIGELTYTNLTSNQTWQFKINSVSMVTGNESAVPVAACQNGCQAIVDSATRLIVGPKSDIRAINKELGAIVFPYSNAEYFDCNHLPTKDVVFNIAGKEFKVTSKDYVVTPKSSLQCPCMSGFVGEDEIDRWVLGNVFQQAVYTEFDVGKLRLGFATAAHNDSEHTVIQ